MGKVIVITGAGSGLGRALARKFAADGDKVMLLGRTLTKLEKVAEDLGEEAMAIACDIGKPDDVRAAFARIAGRHPKIDVLPLRLGAGYFVPSSICPLTCTSTQSGLPLVGRERPPPSSAPYRCNTANLTRRTHVEKNLYALATAIVVIAGLAACNLRNEAQGMPLTSASDTRAREAYITGRPPRIAPLEPDEIDKDEIVDLREAISAPPTAKREVSNYVATMLRHPALYKRHDELAVQLFKGAIMPRDRELAVLRVGWLCQAPFEWGEHVKLGKRLGGLTDDEVARVIVGSTAPGWNEHDRALLRAVEELHAQAMISDETWAVLSRSLDEKQLLELPILVGQYQGNAYLQNSARFRLMPGNVGLSAR